MNRTSRRKGRPRDRVLWIQAGVLIVVLIAALAERFLPGLREGESRPERQELRDFERLMHCQVVPRAGNDGDSFRIRFDGGEEAFRLYFVDAPETDLREQKRLGHQEEYFGQSRERMIEVGGEAKRLVHDLLRPGRFELLTKWEPVMGGERYHALVRLDGRYLHEILVEKGLARIYTMPVDLPDGTRKEVHLRDLSQLERRAKAEGRGGWAR